MRILSIAALFVFVGTAAAEEKQLAGSWSRKADNHELKMVFLKDNMLQFSMNNGDDGCALDAKYTVDNDGVVKCEITKFEKKGNFGVEKEKGYKFSFKVEIKGKVAKISQFDGADIPDEAKSVLEGDYETVAD
jgi:hypothetical protein